MGLDERLGAGRSLDEGGGAGIDVEGALVSVRGVVRRRRQRRRLLGASIAAALVIVVGGIALAVSGRDDAQRVATSPDEDAAPPPVDRSQPYLWLSAQVLPPEGGDLALQFVGGSDGDVVGVEVELERWDGQRWTPYATGITCADAVRCPGKLAEEGDGIPDVGFLVDPQGPLMWLRTGPLPVGWYRLQQTPKDSSAASGRFEVREGAPPTAPSGRDGGAHLSVSPAVRLTSMSSSMATVTAVGELPVSTPTWEQGAVRIERWAVDRWVAVDPGRRPPKLTPSGGGDEEFQVGIDFGSAALEPDAYRLLVDAGEETIDGRFWVVESDQLGWPDVAPGPPEDEGSATAEEAWGAAPGERTGVAGSDDQGNRLVGYVNWDVIAGQDADAAPIAPIYAEPGPSSDEGTIVGYWGTGVGWIQKEVYESSDLDDAALLEVLVEEERDREQQPGGG